MTRNRFLRGVRSGVWQCVLLAIGLVMVAPILYAASLSLMHPQHILASLPKLLPSFPLFFENYAIAMRTTMLGRYTVNSFIISTLSSVSRILLGSTAAFAFAFFEFPFKRILFALSLATMMIPPDVLIVTNYITVSKMGLLNNYLGMSIVFLAAAMNIFLFRQQFLSFSVSLKEAAFLDGCGNVRFYALVLMPSNKPIITTVFISSFVSVWNQYLWPMVVTSSDAMRTVQVGVAMLKFPEGNAYGPLMAGAVIALLPTVLLFICFQKKIVGGMMAGAVKG